MANDNQNQVLDEQTDAVDEKSTKRVRKTKPKASESGSTASLFGIAPYQPKKNEEYMSEGQLEHFRQILLAWKEELMSEVDRTLNTMQDENTALPDVNDRATQEEEFAIELRTRDRERKLIRKLSNQLKRLKMMTMVSVKRVVSKLVCVVWKHVQLQPFVLTAKL